MIEREPRNKSPSGGSTKAGQEPPSSAGDRLREKGVEFALWLASNEALRATPENTALKVLAEEVLRLRAAAHLTDTKAGLPGAAALERQPAREGWVWVPREPTLGFREFVEGWAISIERHGATTDAFWADLLSRYAAPHPTQGEPTDE